MRYKSLDEWSEFDEQQYKIAQNFALLNAYCTQSMKFTEKKNCTKYPCGCNSCIDHCIRTTEENNDAPIAHL